MKVSSFLFVRAYHRALQICMTAQELADKLNVNVKYIYNKRKYLTKILGIQLPVLKKPATEDRYVLRRMVAACHRTVRKINRNHWTNS